MLPTLATPGDSKQPVLTLIDQVYKQWLDAAQQMYKPPAIPKREITP